MESLNFIADQLNKPVIIVDSKLHIVCYNHASEICFQYNAEEVIGKSINILIPIEYHHSHNQLAKHFIDNNESPRLMSKRTGIIYAKRKDGYEFPIDISISNMLMGDQHYAIAVIYNH
ncbi:PAS domain S-box protein [Zooshikella marina]|uniref:PAS domain S-box protein n=1 Tax=Zooshikella ganghwensis TaxID=202772 RepID=UPI001BAFE761|nr:PAS domain S-box protein [Zooshikella ganghwensis]MBU2707572.1 PAS domain S-box protein [Zooshikella ganghwensis]